MNQIEILKGSELSATEQKIMSSGGFATNVVTHFDGKIYNGDIRDEMFNREWLVDMNGYRQKAILGASGKSHDHIKPFSNEYLTYFDDWTKMVEFKKRHPYATLGDCIRNIVGAAGANTADTAYEVVRATNYLQKVVGAQYFMPDYNALEVVNVENVTDMNFKAFAKSSALLTVETGLGDHQVASTQKQTFTASETSIQADGFRYEFTDRELKDSVFNLKSQIDMEIAGAFAKAKDDKVTSAINSATANVSNEADWDAVTGSFYSASAMKAVRKGETGVKAYDGEKVIILPRNTLEYYILNTQAALTSEPMNSTGSGQGLTGILPKNTGLRFFVNDSITERTYAVIAKKHWADFFQGPILNITYKNTMAPAQLQGYITYDFNGLFVRLTNALYKGAGVASAA